MSVRQPVNCRLETDALHSNWVMTHQSMSPLVTGKSFFQEQDQSTYIPT